MNLTHAYGNVITPAIPPALWKLFPRLDDIPRNSFSRVEVHPIAFAREPQGGMFCRKIIGSPEDGALAMCSVYLAHIDGHSVCVANLPDKEKALAYGHEVAAELGLSQRDTHLLERVVTGATFDSIRAGKSSVEPSHEHGAELLDVLNGTAGVAICRRLLAEDPNGMAFEFLRGVVMEMDGRAFSAYADLLESADRPSGA